jgi:creatinine amidohydrolase
MPLARPRRCPLGAALLSLALGCAAAKPARRGVRLQELTWQQAERALTPDAVVVLPLGAASKEHGPHLRLENDLLMAEALAERVLAADPAVVAPTLTYCFYPAFVDYPGSTTLRLETCRDLVVDVVRSLARHGPRRFYLLNTGVSTLRALAPARELLAADGIVFEYLNLLTATAEVEKRLAKQEGGTHADEIETSLMLALAPEAVDMSRAVKDYDAQGKGPLSRTREPGRTYSPTGTWGDPTLATREKGEALIDAMMQAILAQIAALRATPLPH